MIENWIVESILSRLTIQQMYCLRAYYGRMSLNGSVIFVLAAHQHWIVTLKNIGHLRPWRIEVFSSDISISRNRPESELQWVVRQKSRIEKNQILDFAYTSCYRRSLFCGTISWTDCRFLFIQFYAYVNSAYVQRTHSYTYNIHMCLHIHSFLVGYSESEWIQSVFFLPASMQRFNLTRKLCSRS